MVEQFAPDEIALFRMRNAVVGLAFRPHDRLAAKDLGHAEFFCGRGPQLCERLYNVRNHVSGALHNNRIADARIKPFNLVHVVQGRSADCNASDLDWFENRHRC